MNTSIDSNVNDGVFLTKDAAQEIIREGFTAFLYNSKLQSPAVNILFVDVHGKHDREYVKTSHRTYLVIEGEGTFTVGEETRKVHSLDAVIIPPMVPYSYEGKMKLFEVNTPATDSSDKVKL